MAPLNEENDDEDDSTLFDVKYRFVLFTGKMPHVVILLLLQVLSQGNVLHVTEVTVEIFTTVKV